MELEGCSCEEAIVYINKNFKTPEDLKEEIEWVCEMLSKQGELGMYKVNYSCSLESLQHFIEYCNSCKYEIVGITEDKGGYTVIYKTR